MTRAAAAGGCHAVGAQEFPRQLQHVETAAAFAGSVFGLVRWCTHSWAKCSASAMALRMDMDLFTVS